MSLFRQFLKALVFIGLFLPIQNLSANQAANLFSNPSKSVKIGLFHSPPIIILEDGQEPKGFMIDFIQALAIEENWEVQWELDSWANLLDKAKNRQLDLLVFIAFKEERSTYLDYSDENFITGWGQVYTDDKDTFQSVLDFENKQVAILKNEIHGLAFKELCKTFDVNCLTTEVYDFNVAFGMLQNKAVDGVVSGNWVGHNYLESYNIAPTSVIYNPQATLFAVPKFTNADIVKTIDKYVIDWRADKSSPYYEAQEKWLNPHSESAIPQWLKTSLLIISALLIISSFISYILRKQVKRQTETLKRQSEQTRQIIDLIPHFIYAANDKDDIFLMNKYAAEFCGIKLDDYDLLPKAKLIEKYGASVALFGGDSALLKKGQGNHKTELKTINAQGEEVYFDLTKVPFVSSSTESQAVVGVGVDVSASKKYEKQIEHMSYHDPLTQLPNRILLNDRLRQSLALSVRQGYSGAILLIDLDDFKTFNHKYGPQGGDKILKELAVRVSGLIKDGDTIARLSSDAFVVQLNELSIKPHEAHDKAFAVANKIQETINLPITVDRSAIYITASIGVVIYPFDGKNVLNIIPRAEAAMRQAKLNGKKNIVRFTSEMETAVFQKHLINNELQNAINNNEFELHYQPQFEHNSQKPIGFEALIRWSHNRHGIIYPGDFIPAAEENNLIISIGYWVIEEAFKHARKLQETSLKDTFIGINLSVVQITDPNLIPLVKSLIKQYDIIPEKIEFEITETVLFQDIEDSIDALNALKKLGCKLSIDDFGTGYSSLSYINQLPLDKLKLDRSFIKDIEKDKGSQAIVKTIVNLSKDLGLKVLAEGVEEKAQLSYLESIGCEYYQGFYFDKALNFNELLSTYSNNTRHASVEELNNNSHI